MIKTAFRGGIGAGFNYADTYKEVLSRFESGVFVEIGLWDGESTVCMAEMIRDSGKQIEFYAIDPFTPFEIDGVMHQADYNVYLQNIEHVKDYITTLVEDSLSVTGKVIDKTVDFVFIDGNHEYEFVKKDIEAWLPKVKRGGIIGGHDYDMEGVKKAVDERFKNIELFPNTTWLVQL